jgi:F-type H+-transporting ATPase subunit delta
MLASPQITILLKGLCVANSSTQLAQRYAQSLFDLALEAKSVEGVQSALNGFNGLISSSPDLLTLVKSPIFTSDEQLRAISAVLENAKLDGLAANFIKTVTGNRRLFALPSIIEAFNAIVSTHKGEIRAHVTVAKALSDAESTELKATLKAKLGKDPILDIAIDPSILGGLIVKVGSKMIDTSLKTQLNSLKNVMKEVG